MRELIDLIEQYVNAVDREMEHGHYQTPEFVPPEYEDEEDYYEEHCRIVDDVCAIRMKIRDKIKELKGIAK